MASSNSNDGSPQQKNPTDSTSRIKEITDKLTELRRILTDARKPTDAKKEESEGTQQVQEDGEDKDKSKGTQQVQEDGEEKDIYSQLDKAEKELNYMIGAFKKLVAFEDDISKSLETLERNVKDIGADLGRAKVDHIPDESLKQTIERNLKVLRGNLTKVKILIPLQHQVSIAGSEERRYNLQTTVASKEVLPNPYEARLIFESGSFVKEFQDHYKALDIRRKLCLLCFAIFPENAEVRTRLLRFWWLGERLTDPKEMDFVNKTLGEFVEKGLIEPVTKKGKLQATSYKMHPIIRSLIIMLAMEANFFDYDSKGNPTMDISASKKSCLVKSDPGTPSWFSKNFGRKWQTVSSKNQQKENNVEQKEEPQQIGDEKGENLMQGIQQGTSSWFLKKFSQSRTKQLPKSSDKQQKENKQMRQNTPGKKEGKQEKIPDEQRIKLEKQRQKNLDELQTLFNVSKQFPDLPVELFSKMRNIGVLYLGRWESTAERHIEVENADFLNGLKNMRKLRFFSLQGISGISKLPKSLSKLTNLRILDLRACHNLEKLPKEIGSLKSLTRLDLSECYLLDSISKQLSHLPKLEVLKGFVISENSSCTLQNLAALQNLKKLSINVNSNKFNIDEAAKVFSKLTALQKLKIAWGAGGEEASKLANGNKATTAAEKSDTDANKQGSDAAKREATIWGVNLVKLDLQCFPRRHPPEWLAPERLTKLQHLYIRGGILSNLSKTESPSNEKWKVETLHLKFLTDVKTNWKELQTQFPNLNYLEKVKCPQITFCPCDANGVWKSKQP